jgi:hypothetical protein
VNKADALHIAMTAIMREILREDGPGAIVPAPGLHAPPPEDDPNPRPQFDFDESTCTHGDLVVDRSICPVHGPGATGPAPSAEELDDMTGETFDEGNPLIARARRKKALEERRAAQQRLYPEDLPMAGMGPPDPDNPPLVV